MCLKAISTIETTGHIMTDCLPQNLVPAFGCENGISRICEPHPSSHVRVKQLSAAGYKALSQHKNTYRSIDRERWVPRVWGYDFANAIFPTLWSNLLDVDHRILKFLSSRAESGRFLQAVGSYALECLPSPCSLAFSFYRAHVQWWRGSQAERNVRLVGFVGTVRLHIGGICWSHGRIGGGGATSSGGRNNHHE